MKTQSTVEIPAIQDLGTGRFYYHFNHRTFERVNGEKTETVNEAETVLLDGYPTEESIVAAMVEEGYEITDAILDQIEKAVE